MNKVAVIQSNYIPWKGYFDIIHDADVFVFYDDVSYTKNDWRNRNKIKTTNGSTWLTIPTGDKINRLICEVALNDTLWANKHWKSICQYYSKAPYFKHFKPFFEEIYMGTRWLSLSQLNQFLIRSIAHDFLGITTVFKDSREFSVNGTNLERLLDLLTKAKAETYISGPSARAYIDKKQFENKRINLIYKDYSSYPKYPQFHPPFDHYVTILDLLFHTGPDAPYYIWGWRNT
ncbi:MAG: WbqC family protein [Candidatus Aquicultorales bacterium]